jgi:hypothetical protein
MRQLARLETARQQWEEGHRRLQEQAGDPERYSRLLGEVEAVTEELRRRIGATFTLAQLAEAYAEAEDWTRVALAAGATGQSVCRRLVRRTKHAMERP